MRNSLDNISARWAAFVSGLALRSTDLRTALAAEYAATLLPVIEESLAALPARYSDRLAAIHAAMTAVRNDEQRGWIASSVEALTDEELHDLTDELVSLAFVVHFLRTSPPLNDE